MRDIAGNIAGDACHPDWHEYMREWISFDNWRSDEGLLLLAGIWPVEAKISDSEVSSPRYGTIEPPVIIHAGLLDQECNVQFLREDYQRLLVLAGRRLRLIREHWMRGDHTEIRYPPAYFVQWAESKNIIPCWLDIWLKHIVTVNIDSAKSEASAAIPISGVTKSQSLPRKRPEGGDTLTPMIWEICYTLYETGTKPTPSSVMSELQMRAASADRKLKGPLMSPVAGGVKYENVEGDEKELNSNRLQSRINEWKKANSVG